MGLVGPGHPGGDARCGLCWRHPNACAHLDRMVDSLEAYVALAPPETPLTAGDKEESYLRETPSVTRRQEATIPDLREGPESSSTN